jgi:hypothetical protein
LLLPACSSKEQPPIAKTVRQTTEENPESAQAEQHMTEGRIKEEDSGLTSTMNRINASDSEKPELTDDEYDELRSIAKDFERLKHMCQEYSRKKREGVVDDSIIQRTTQLLEELTKRLERWGRENPDTFIEEWLKGHDLPPPPFDSPVPPREE